MKRLFGIDVRALVFFRMGLAALVLLNLFYLFSDFEAFYTSRGILPISVLGDESPFPERFSLYFFHNSRTWAWALFAITVICAVLLLAGFRSRLMSVAVWVLVLSLQARNPLVLNGGDHLFRTLLFWSMFLPLNGKNTGGHSSVIVSLSSAALLIQVCLVYGATFLAKIQLPVWQKGSAVSYVLHNPDYARPIGTWVASWPALLPVLNYTVMGLEGLAPFLLLCSAGYKRARLIALSLLGLMHVAFALCLDIGFFPCVSIVALLPFLPSAAISSTRQEKGPMIWPGRVIVAFALFSAILFSLGNTQSNKTISVSGPWGKLVYAFYLDQSWRMFAPPNAASYRFAINELPNFNWNVRWRKYAQNLIAPQFYAYKTYWANFLCAQISREQESVSNSVARTTVILEVIPLLSGQQKKSIPFLQAICS